MATDVPDMVESLKSEIVRAWKTVEESNAEKEMLISRVESLQRELVKAQEDLSRSLSAYMRLSRVQLRTGRIGSGRDAAERRAEGAERSFQLVRPT